MYAAPANKAVNDAVCLAAGLSSQQQGPLNDDGIPTHSANRTKTGWGPPTVMGILDNPVYLGTAAYGRRDGKQKPQDPSTWLYSESPAIVDRARWCAARAAR